jgi:hypothetical protein
MLHPKKSDSDMSPDLEQYMQINQSQQRAAEEASLIFNGDPLTLFGLANIPIVACRTILRQYMFLFSSDSVRSLLH